jgi:hypothetical protein
MGIRDNFYFLCPQSNTALVRTAQEGSCDNKEMEGNMVACIILSMKSQRTFGEFIHTRVPPSLHRDGKDVRR